MKRSYSNWLVIAAAITLCVMIALVGCAAPVTTPTTTVQQVVKPVKFTIPIITDISGPVSPNCVPQVQACKYYADWLNTTKSGLRGVPVEFIALDTGYKIDATMSQNSKVKDYSPKPTIIFTMSSPDSEALKDRVNEDKIVDYAEGNSPFAMYPVGYTVACAPSYVDMIGGFMNWVTDDWAKKTGQKVKLAILTWNTSTGKAILTDEMRAYAKEKGIEIVAEELFNATDVDVSTQLSKIKAAGANWVYDNSIAAAAGIINKSADTLGMMNHNLYDTTPGMIHHCTNHINQSINYFGAAVKESEGMIGMGWAIQIEETDREGVKLALQYADKNNLKPIERNTTYLAGFNFGAHICEIIGRTVDAVGWDKVNGTTAREQVWKMKDFSPLGLYPYSYSSIKPEPNQGRVWQWKDGNITLLTPYFSTPNLAPAKYR